MFNLRYLFALFLTLFLVVNAHAVNYISCHDYPDNSACIYPEKYPDLLSDDDFFSDDFFSDDLLDDDLISDDDV